jgi:hypothetical protein
MNYVSIMRVVEQVYRSGLNTEDINFFDMIEWVGEAIAKIGVSYAYIEVVTNGLEGMPDPITITDYSGTLPTDLIIIRGVRDSDTHSSLIKETGTFRSTYGSNNLPSAGDQTMAAYRTEDGYIYTNIEECDLEISYLAWKTDEDGYPMIPDDERYITAVKAYIMYMIAFRMWLQDNISADKFQVLEKEWLFYVKSAKTKAHMPDFDSMEALKNQMRKLATNPNHHASQFAYLSTP